MASLFPCLPIAFFYFFFVFSFLARLLDFSCSLLLSFTIPFSIDCARSRSLFPVLSYCLIFLSPSASSITPSFLSLVCCPLLIFSSVLHSSCACSPLSSLCCALFICSVPSLLSFNYFLSTFFVASFCFILISTFFVFLSHFSLLPCHIPPCFSSPSYLRLLPTSYFLLIAVLFSFPCFLYCFFYFTFYIVPPYVSCLLYISRTKVSIL